MQVEQEIPLTTAQEQFVMKVLAVNTAGALGAIETGEVGMLNDSSGRKVIDHLSTISTGDDLPAAVAAVRLANELVAKDFVGPKLIDVADEIVTMAPGHVQAAMFE